MPYFEEKFNFLNIYTYIFIDLYSIFFVKLYVKKEYYIINKYKAIYPCTPIRKWEIPPVIILLMISLSRLGIEYMYNVSEYRYDICPSILKMEITLIILIASHGSNLITNRRTIIALQIKLILMKTYISSNIYKCVLSKICSYSNNMLI